MNADLEIGDGPPSRLRRRRQRMGRHQAPQLNIVSLIDVFAVLVFFLLSGASISAAKLQALQLKMAAPSVQTQVPGANSDSELVVRLSEQGISVSFGDRKQDFPALTEHRDLQAMTAFLQKLKALYPEERRATLAVEDQVNYADIVEVMALLSRGTTEQGSSLFPDIALANISSATAEQRGGG